MAKPRKKYRPRPVIANPVAFVVERVQPIAAVDDQLLVLRNKNHAAMEAVVRGRADRRDVDVLVAASNMASSIASLHGFGKEYTAEIEAGATAILHMGRRGVTGGDRFLFTGPEMQAVNQLLDVHDAQLSIITVGELDAALQRVQKQLRSGYARAIVQKEKAQCIPTSSL